MWVKIQNHQHKLSRAHKCNFSAANMRVVEEETPVLTYPIMGPVEVFIMSSVIKYT